MRESCPLELLRTLISFKSISRQSNLDVVDFLEAFLRPLGFETTRIKSPEEPLRANLLCRIGPDREGGLMLSGHTDVVPVAGQNWLNDPFCLTEQEGKLIGRGTADMKGFIAATCHALTKMSLSQLKKPLTLLWTYDEEVGCQGSAVAMPQLKNYLKFLPKAALIGEPTDFKILRMHSGHVTMRISAKGKGAHSSDPDLGISAIKAINAALNGIFELEEELKAETSHEEFFKRPFVSLNVGQIHGGSAVNIVPDEAYVLVGFRPLPNTSIEKTYERIVMACKRHQRDERVRLTTGIEACTPPMITHSGSILERVVMPEAKSKDTGAAQFSTDGGNISQGGIECLIFGPGTIDVAHQANEWIYREDLFTAATKIGRIVDDFFADS